MEGIGAIFELNTREPRERVQHVIALLDAAVGELHRDHSAKGTILEAASLLRQQIDAQAAAGIEEGGGLLAWQRRKVLAHIDSHIAGPIRVGELSALIQRSEAHFSRAFKHTFGASPHAFVIRRRVELAARCMLETDAFLSEIALRCGFTDQAHLCKHFRQATGQTPGAWRRVRRMHNLGNHSGDAASADVATGSRPVLPANQVPRSISI